MVEDLGELDSVFGALADPTRRRMLEDLSRGPQTVGRLAQPHAMSLAGASKHLLVLEKARLLRREKRGREVICKLAPGPLAKADAWLSRYQIYWTGRLDQLEAVLRATQEDADD